MGTAFVCCHGHAISTSLYCYSAGEVHTHMPCRGDWRDEAVTEAYIASAPRLLIERFDMGSFCLFIDIHITGPSRRIPFAVDTQRCNPRPPHVLTLHLCQCPG
jgi:hypothetical protein